MVKARNTVIVNLYRHNLLVPNLLVDEDLELAHIHQEEEEATTKAGEREQQQEPLELNHNIQVNHKNYLPAMEKEDY